MVEISEMDDEGAHEAPEKVVREKTVVVYPRLEYPTYEDARSFVKACKAFKSTHKNVRLKMKDQIDSYVLEVM